MATPSLFGGVTRCCPKDLIRRKGSEVRLVGGRLDFRRSARLQGFTTGAGSTPTRDLARVLRDVTRVKRTSVTPAHDRGDTARAHATGVHCARCFALARAAISLHTVRDALDHAAPRARRGADRRAIRRSGCHRTRTDSAGATAAAASTRADATAAARSGSDARSYAEAESQAQADTEAEAPSRSGAASQPPTQS